MSENELHRASRLSNPAARKPWRAPKIEDAGIAKLTESGVYVGGLETPTVYTYRKPPS